MTPNRTARRVRAHELARSPREGASAIDTTHNVACALAYIHIAEAPEHSTEDIDFGRFLLVETVLHTLELLVHRLERESKAQGRKDEGRAAP
jgi:hypothetical protein